MYSELFDRPNFSGNGSDAPLYGVFVGIVTNNQDPDNLGRVKVRFPWLSDEVESTWARIATPMAGGDRGLYLLPEVDDEVLVAFEGGSAEFPYVLGALWNGQDAPPDSNDDGENNVRSLTSRSGHVVRFDDTDGSEKIEILDSSGNNSITLDTANNTIAIVADSDITIESSNGKLVLSGNGVEISSQAELKIEASQTLDIQGGPELNIQGDMVNIN
ncbi:phage baseplate assembly protein V [Geitlerinema sp. CS-897]|nr:phage baseplate assembly protein V [Geitlerinema sp. CS-897]